MGGKADEKNGGYLVQANKPGLLIYSWRSPTRSKPSRRINSRDVERVLTDLYGDRLDRVILYESYARGDFHAESDVDYLVVLKDTLIEGGREIRRMAPIIGPLSLAYEVEVSVFPTSTMKYKSGGTFLDQAAQEEGICL